MAKAIEVLKPHFASGDFGGGYHVPKLEPMFIKSMNFGEGEGIGLHLSDTNIYGTSNFKIDKLRVNMKDLKFEALITVPKLTTYAKYQMQFKFFGNQLKTSGDYHIVHENSKIVLPIKLNRVVKNGIEVMRFDPIPIKFMQGNVLKLTMSNLFGGNKAIEEIILSFLLNNQEFIGDNVRHEIEANLSKIFTKIANDILESTTFDEMFL
ncbi:protein takeout-like [Chironomus tepperi]|uniref:protein takeout-like n=1 Tax=Chironomus tepperi TaxID=113505 RepID=UPI00391FC2E2